MDAIESGERGIKRPYEYDVSDNTSSPPNKQLCLQKDEPKSSCTSKTHADDDSGDRRTFSTNESINQEGDTDGYKEKLSVDTSPSPSKTRNDSSSSQESPVKSKSDSKSPNKESPSKDKKRQAEEHMEEERAYYRNKREKQEKERQKMQ